ncbi:non-canonical purine NTP pyrophosphatase [Microlunatus endophyticus]|uniref:dITP/XTP pyrophosphatase n=1 Tax=Microlunatus endophyticus TaxID=1716077 RepID=A0A917S7H5_9ACTN|nr:non-canonical purine NTP pyrophosphatase [Microlunatus endophyticus]GGL60003.1 non-canonical purine NTP pyrophosphatase [Microlunatus endophyticus]
MAYEVVLATGNAKKLVELRRMVAENPAAAALDIQVHGLADFPAYPQPAETERTFEGNALIKARTAVARTGLPALADDSGLAVDELNGMPGVRSARWSGPDATDDSNNALLLAQLDDVADERRAAQFVSAVALVLPDGREFVRHGRMAGRLLSELRGDNGFGYDPMFVADATVAAGRQLSNGELSAEEKDAISHRGIAVRAIVEVLVDLVKEAV